MYYLNIYTDGNPGELVFGIDAAVREIIDAYGGSYSHTVLLKKGIPSIIDLSPEVEAYEERMAKDEAREYCIREKLLSLP